MRQACALAAGIIVLEEMIERLAEGYYHTKLLADGLAQIYRLEFDKGLPQTNMVFIKLKDAVQQSAD